MELEQRIMHKYQSVQTAELEVITELRLLQEQAKDIPDQEKAFEKQKRAIKEQMEIIEKQERVVEEKKNSLQRQIDICLQQSEAIQEETKKLQKDLECATWLKQRYPNFPICPVPVQRQEPGKGRRGRIADLEAVDHWALYNLPLSNIQGVQKDNHLKEGRSGIRVKSGNDEIRIRLVPIDEKGNLIELSEDLIICRSEHAAYLVESHGLAIIPFIWYALGVCKNKSWEHIRCASEKLWIGGICVFEEVKCDLGLYQ